MKKIATVIFLFLLIIVTGCGKEKSVVCALVEDYDIYSIESKITTTVEDGFVVPDVLTITMTFDEEEVAKSSYENLKKEYTNITIKGNVITIIEEDTKKEAIDREEFINAYAQDGYACE